MGIFNEHSNNQPQQNLRGLRGTPGVGFSLTSDGNYDMKNKNGFIDGPFIPQDTQSKKSEYIESA